VGAGGVDEGGGVDSVCVGGGVDGVDGVCAVGGVDAAGGVCPSAGAGGVPGAGVGSAAGAGGVEGAGVGSDGVGGVDSVCAAEGIAAHTVRTAMLTAYRTFGMTPAREPNRIVRKGLSAR
jgi:hypothetical protein